MEQSSDEPLPFWFDDRKPGASEEELERAEEYVGQVLPAELRALLRERDGGVSNFVGYEKGDLYLPFLPIFGVSAEPAAGTVMRAFDVRKEFGVPDYVVPFAGQGHSWWGLDYRIDREAPRVVFCEGKDEEILVAASSFRELMDGLLEG